MLKESNNLNNKFLNFKNLNNNPYFSNLILKTDNDMNNDMNNDTNNDMNKHLNPTELRISTMTAICNININIHLQKFYEKVCVTPYNLSTLASDNSIKFPFIQCCQFGNDNLKGFNNKKSVKKRTKFKVKKRNYFQNQMTLIIYLSSTRSVNLKIFLNGKIQMTGMKSREEGYIACGKILEEIQKIRKQYPEVVNEENTSLNTGEITDFSIVLIKCDFYAGCKLKRDKVYEKLYKNHYFVSYEPDIYPAVNAKYYWNISTEGSNNAGICQCKSTCEGKGTGEGEGQCKKITIATFQSGNMIITGARTEQQTKDVYKFINDFFLTYYNDIVRTSNEDMNQEPINSMRKINVKITDIVNYDIRDSLIDFKI
jgi:TATA-box binding protein (TBP) (component of TFIID and TFIIIB)